MMHSVPPKLDDLALGVPSLERVGKTRMFRLARIARDVPGIELLGKAEWINPGGSVKDRAASNIVREGRRVTESSLREGGLRCHQRQYRHCFRNDRRSGGFSGDPLHAGKCLHRAQTDSRRVRREHCLYRSGRRLRWRHPQGSQVCAQDPEKYFYADQYSNDANWQAHYHGTANEIWQQTEGRITHFLSMMGTSGTFVGTSRRLKELNPKVRCISLQPDSPFHGIEGAKHMASALVPKRFYDPTIADEDLGISTEESYAMCKRLAREEGLLVGISAASAIVGCLQVARRLPQAGGAVFVARSATGAINI